ncbi:AraC family transcriptional regulator [Acinetobacter sp. ANC 4654]|uniref:AraC family transcriptional regulator n=1 Tax=Acinetobacter sp. ANC 4654 TaxID=1977872 RepID=UPI001BB46604|nr:AraC family transcriptional regulator [Acinetobacter sp. ANC 4654]
MLENEQNVISQPEPNVQFWRDSRMPYVETRQACQSQICYKAHSHTTFSIGAVDTGLSRFSSYLSAVEMIESGALVVIPAQVEHSCNPMPNQAWSYQMMHLNADWLAALLSETVREQIHAPIPQLKPSVIKEPELYCAFTQLNRDLFNPEVDFREKEQRLIEVLTQIVLPCFEWEKTDTSHYFYDHLKDLIIYLKDVDTIVPLEKLASMLGISRYAVIRLFKANLGLTPHAFQLNLKVNQARELLKYGKNVADISYELGFSDQSHFHRVFKIHTGVTPRQYQQGFI